LSYEPNEIKAKSVDKDTARLLRDRALTKTKIEGRRHSVVQGIANIEHDLSSKELDATSRSRLETQAEERKVEQGLLDDLLKVAQKEVPYRVFFTVNGNEVVIAEAKSAGPEPKSPDPTGAKRGGKTGK
jgi:hypothetical protein